jgi:DnaJ-domain-containing protein 1
MSKRLSNAGSDKTGTLGAWNNCGVKERDYRKAAETDARLNAPKPDGNAWWEILGIAPSSPDDVLRTAYTEALKQCHPDRVSGLAPQLIQLAEEMAKRLNRAFEEGKRRPAWWIA